jgi:hypothetical protein
MPTPRQFKDTIKNIITEVMQRHAAAAIEEIAAAMADEVEALAADRVVDLRPQLESGNDPPQLFPELEELPQTVECDNAYDGERDAWDGTREAFAVIRERVRNGGPGWSPQ